MTSSQVWLSKGNLRKSCRKKGGIKKGKNVTGKVKSRPMKKQKYDGKKETDHATCKVVVLPGGVDYGAVLVKPD